MKYSKLEVIHLEFVLSQVIGVYLVVMWNIWGAENAAWLILQNAFSILDGSNECQDLMMQRFVTSAEAEAREAVKRDSQVEEKLRHTQEKLGLKEKEVKGRIW